MPCSPADAVRACARALGPGRAGWFAFPPLGSSSFPPPADGYGTMCRHAGNGIFLIALSALLGGRPVKAEPASHMAPAPGCVTFLGLKLQPSPGERSLPSVRPSWRVQAVARAGRPRAARRLNPRDGRQRRGRGGRAAGGDGPTAGTRGARRTASESRASADAEMLFFHPATHECVHLEPSFRCTGVDAYAHVILTSRLSHPCIKEPREPKLIHLFATEDGSVSKLFY